MSHHLDSPLARRDVRLEITDLCVFRGETGTVLAVLLDASQRAVASLATDAGGWRSINRVGLPTIHSLFAQFNEKLGDDLNGSRPSDLKTYGKLLTHETAGVVRADGTAVDPEDYASAVVRRFLPNMLPDLVGTPASSWNGRSLTDNAPNVMLSIAPNTPVSLRIAKESVTSKPRDSFPYVPAAS